LLFFQLAGAIGWLLEGFIFSTGTYSQNSLRWRGTCSHTCHLAVFDVAKFNSVSLSRWR
jgi:hypothetical protein